MRLLGMLLVSVVLTLAFPQPAGAERPGCMVVQETGKCRVGVTLSGSSASSPDDSTGGEGTSLSTEVGASAPRQCSQAGRSVPCTTALGDWSDSTSSWCRLAVPQPPRSDPIWAGRDSGAIYACTRAIYGDIANPGETVLRWLPGPPELAPPDPEELARRLLASIEFEAPEIGMFPRGDSAERMGYVGWNAWMWAVVTSDGQ